MAKPEPAALRQPRLSSSSILFFRLSALSQGDDGVSFAPAVARDIAVGAMSPAAATGKESGN